MKEAGAVWRVRIAAISAGENARQGSVNGMDDEGGTGEGVAVFGPLVVWIWFASWLKDQWQRKSYPRSDTATDEWLPHDTLPVLSVGAST